MLAATSEISARHAHEATEVERFADGAQLLVVIVNFKTPKLAIEALRSLVPEIRSRPAACPSIRVVIVDNASGDGSVQMIREAIAQQGLADIALCVASTCNGGYAYGNNLAVRTALKAKNPPPYFLLLNPDTQAEAGALASLVSFLDAHPKAGIAGSGLLNEDGSAWSTAFRFPSILSEVELGVRLGAVTKLLENHVVARKMGSAPERCDWLPGASMIVRKTVFDQIGLMDEGYFLYYEETDFCLQAARAGWECWYVPESRVIHVAGQSTGVTIRKGTLKRRPAYVFESRLRYFTKNYGLAYAALADVAWAASFATWRVRRVVQRKPDPDPPHLLEDSIRHSVFANLLSRSKKSALEGRL